MEGWESHKMANSTQNCLSRYMTPGVCELILLHLARWKKLSSMVISQSACHRVNLSLLKQNGKSYTCYTGIACLSIFRHMATNRKSSGAIFAWFICNFITPCHRHIINYPVKYNNARIKITLITCFLVHVSGWDLMCHLQCTQKRYSVDEGDMCE